jgi:parallel beta-helix repeat protein
MRIVPVLLIVLILIAPIVPAAPGPSAESGLATACMRSDATKPCEHLRVILDTHVGAGETATFQNGTYDAQGTVTVGAGGRVVVDNATIRFAGSSAGFVVEAGGALVVKHSRLEEASAGSGFGIDARAASSLALVATEVLGGSGIAVATEDAQIHDNRIAHIDVALRLHGVSVEIHHNLFEDNAVSANNTGGAPTYHNNTFVGGAFCIRDWYTDPVIRFNTFVDCHVGIWHERSESVLSDNTMQDSAAPPGGGIMVVDTMSPLIERNNISMYGTGILIVNARAYVRDNVVHHNVGAGIRVLGNSAPMDIQRNHVYANGGDGIALEGVSSMVVSHNDVGGNGGHGIRIVEAVEVEVADNDVRGNGLDGLVVESSPGPLLARNRAAANEGDGIVVRDSDATQLVGGWANGNGGRGYVVARSNGSALSGFEARDNTVGGLDASDTDGLALGPAVATGSPYGFRLASTAALAAHNISASGNGIGVWLLGASGTVDDLDVRLNADGVRAERDDTSAGGGRPTLDLVRALVFDNARYGIHNVAGNATSARGAWFEGNAVAGVMSEANASFDARNSYWGSPNGPTHANNAGGDGDAVFGNVAYHPYLTASPGSTPPPTYDGGVVG